MRSGRPAAAPLLQRESIGPFENVNPDQDVLKSFEEQPMHDPEIIPRQIAQDDIAQLFPSIMPAPQGELGKRDVQ